MAVASAVLAAVTLGLAAAPASAMKLRPMDVPRSMDGEWVTLEPKYARGKKDAVTSAIVRVRKGGKLVGAAPRVRVGTGQYAIQQVITYRYLNTLKNVPVREQRYANAPDPDAESAPCVVKKQDIRWEDDPDYPSMGTAHVTYALSCDFPSLSIRPVSARLNRDYAYLCPECWADARPTEVGQPLTSESTVVVNQQTGKRRWGPIRKAVSKPQRVTVRYFNRPCVTYGEQSQLQRRQTTAQVRAIFGDWGTKDFSLYYDGINYVTRTYDYCDVYYDDWGNPTSAEHLYVYFQNGRVSGWLFP